MLIDKQWNDLFKFIIVIAMLLSVLNWMFELDLSKGYPSIISATAVVFYFLSSVFAMYVLYHARSDTFGPEPSSNENPFFLFNRVWSVLFLSLMFAYAGFLNELFLFWIRYTTSQTLQSGLPLSSIASALLLTASVLFIPLLIDRWERALSDVRDMAEHQGFTQRQTLLCYHYLKWVREFAEKLQWAFRATVLTNGSLIAFFVLGLSLDFRMSETNSYWPGALIYILSLAMGHK